MSHATIRAHGCAVDCSHLVQAAVYTAFEKVQRDLDELEISSDDEEVSKKYDPMKDEVLQTVASKVKVRTPWLAPGVVEASPAACTQHGQGTVVADKGGRATIRYDGYDAMAKERERSRRAQAERARRNRQIMMGLQVRIPRRVRGRVAWLM